MKKAAIFDFDHTLIEGDSLWPYLGYAVGKGLSYVALAEALAVLTLRYVQFRQPESARTFIKDRILRNLLAGKKQAALAPASARTRIWQKENAQMMRRLQEHRANGDVIVIASGSLDLYLPILLRDIPHDALICTEIGVKNGIVTGEMIKGNCVRQNKAARVKEWLDANGPFDETYGYGNYPHDVPMLNLVKHRIIVS
ncbi:MAG: HAD family hydrolase [Alphaproteobacteria bacterium]